MDGEDDDDVPELRVQIENVRGPLKEWVTLEDVRREIALKFKRFLRSWSSAPKKTKALGTGSSSSCPGGEPGIDLVYGKAIENAVRKNAQSIEVVFGDFAAAEPTLASWLISAPTPMLEVLHEAAFDVTQEIYPNLSAITRAMYVRVVQIPGSDRYDDGRVYIYIYMIG